MDNSRRAFFFGMTLSEIGFILFFALLLFAFYQFDADRNKLIAANRDRGTAETKADRSEQELVEVREKLANARALERAAELMESVPRERMDELFEKLVPAIQAEARIQELEGENANLKTELEEYTEVRSELRRLVEDLSESSPKQLREQMSMCEALARNDISPEDLETPELLRAAKELSKTLDQVQTADGTAGSKSIGEAFEEFLSARQDLTSCEGQVAHLTRRMNARGGRDLPPCWASPDGRVEYLFQIIILDDGLVMSSAAPESRARDYARIPNARELTTRKLSLTAFKKLAQPILDASNARQCRHYVSIRDQSERSYKSTLTIEDYFYKFVNRS